MPEQFQIQISEHLDRTWADWFDGLVITYLPTGDTLLTGTLPDQAALHGIIERIRDLGLTLRAITPVAQDGLIHERA